MEQEKLKVNITLEDYATFLNSIDIPSRFMSSSFQGNIWDIWYEEINIQNKYPGDIYIHSSDIKKVHDYFMNRNLIWELTSKGEDFWGDLYSYLQNYIPVDSVLSITFNNINDDSFIPINI